MQMSWAVIGRYCVPEEGRPTHLTIMQCYTRFSWVDWPFSNCVSVWMCCGLWIDPFQTGICLPFVYLHVPKICLSICRHHLLTSKVTKAEKKLCQKWPFECCGKRLKIGDDLEKHINVKHKKSILSHLTPPGDQIWTHKSSARSNKSKANTNRDRTSKPHKNENKLQNRLDNLPDYYCHILKMLQTWSYTTFCLIGIFNIAVFFKSTNLGFTLKSVLGQARCSAVWKHLVRVGWHGRFHKGLLGHLGTPWYTNTILILDFIGV